MRIVFNLVRLNTSQTYPTLIMNIQSTKQPQTYMFNTIPGIERIIDQEQIKFNQDLKIFFTKSDNQRVAGLTALLIHIWQQKKSYGVRLYTDDKYFNFFPNLYYCLGLKLLGVGNINLNNPKLQGQVPTINFDSQLIGKYASQYVQFKSFKEICDNIKTYFSKNTVDLQSDIGYDENGNFYIINSKNNKNQQDSYIYPIIINENSEFQTISYLIKIPAQTSFNKEKLQEIKFTDKKHIQLMKNGVVEFKGKTYKKEDFQEEIEEKTILIFDFQNDKSQNQDFLVQILSEKLNKLQIQFKNINLIVHLTDQLNIDSEQYSKFLDFIDKENQIVNNLFCNSQNQFIIKDNKEQFYQNVQINPQNQDNIKYLDSLQKNSYYQFLQIFKINSSFCKFFPNSFTKINKNAVIGELQNPQQQQQNQSFKKLKNSYFYPYQKQLILQSANNLIFQDLPQNKINGGFNFFAQNSQQFKQYINNLQTINKGVDIFLNKNAENQFPQVTILGSASSFANQARGTSCYYLQINEQNSMMLDCGSGSFSQFYLNFYQNLGQKDVILELNKLKILFISHYHSDHHMGIIDLCQKRKQYNIQEKLIVILPKNLMKFYQSFNQNIEDLNIQFWTHEQFMNMQNLKQKNVQQNQIQNKNNLQNQAKNYKSDLGDSDDILIIDSQDSQEYIQNEQQQLKLDLKQLGIKQLNIVSVDHCPESHGIIIDLINEKKRIVYSGDTKFSINLLKNGQNADILIHECTFHQKNKQRAQQTNHSTFNDAVALANKIKAKQLLVTHFSQRGTIYQLSSNINIFGNKCQFQDKLMKKSDLDYVNKNVIWAFDFLKIPLKQSHNLPDLTRFLFLSQT